MDGFIGAGFVGEFGVWAQDSSGLSLGDLARKTRKEHSEPGHVSGMQLVTEEEDGPYTTGIRRVRVSEL